jgi:short-subunit dehydrogenase involved in D-alanine esterification of teichoic acids
MSMKKTALVVGGTSGLGLELAVRLTNIYDYDVIVTGRTNPKQEQLTFRYLELAPPGGLPGERNAIRGLVDTVSLPTIDLLIYAAGFYQEGKIEKVGVDADIMLSVGLYAPIVLLEMLLRKQRKLEGFIAITSTSQWTPRLEEPVYTAVKAGLGMLAHSVSLDERVGKVMVAAPSGMKTKFWAEDGRDTSEMLSPSWVADQILLQYMRDYEYMFLKILRQPSRIEIASMREH